MRIATGLLSVLLFTGTVFAQGAGPAALTAASDVIFTGRLERIEIAPAAFTARFKIDHSIKGLPEDAGTQRILVPVSSPCHRLEENHSYLVYGRRVGDDLWMDPCESKVISRAEMDLRYLHTLNPKVAERCNRGRINKLALQSPIVAIGDLLGTEDSMGTSTAFFRPWCGVVATTEDAYYTITDVLKGNVPEARIAVEHLICWDTVTADEYNPALSRDLFNEGNRLLLFLKPDSSQSHRQLPDGFKAVYHDIDENCGAVSADDEVAQIVIDSIRTNPAKYRAWLNEDVDCLAGENGQKSCAVTRETSSP